MAIYCKKEKEFSQLCQSYAEGDSRRPSGHGIRRRRMSEAESESRFSRWENEPRRGPFGARAPEAYSDRAFSFLLLQLFGPIIPSCTGAPLLVGGAERMCTLCDFLALIDNLVKFAAVLAPILVTIFAVWGAFLIITSAGSKDKIVKGRAIILNAVIGLLIVVGAWVIVSTTFLVLTGNYQGPLPMPWYRIRC